MSDRTPFAHLAATPANHFRLYFYAAVAHVMAAAARVGSEPITGCLRALAGYDEELRACGVPEAQGAGWSDAIAEWERTADEFLPARALREALGVELDDMVLVFTAGLIEEDARFGALFERLNEAHGQGGQPRATIAVLADCRREGHGADVRAPLRLLADSGLVRIANADAPRVQQGIEVPAAIWDVLRGERHERPLPWLRYLPPSALPGPNDTILSAPLGAALSAVPRLIASGAARTIVVRGPLHNGRRTLLGAIARASGRGVLEMAAADRLDDERWRLVVLLATAMQAMPVLACEPGPG